MGIRGSENKVDAHGAKPVSGFETAWDHFPLQYDESVRCFITFGKVNVLDFVIFVDVQIGWEGEGMETVDDVDETTAHDGGALSFVASEIFAMDFVGSCVVELEAGLFVVGSDERNLKVDVVSVFHDISECALDVKFVAQFDEVNVSATDQTEIV